MFKKIISVLRKPVKVVLSLVALLIISIILASFFDCMIIFSEITFITTCFVVAVYGIVGVINHIVQDRKK